MMLLVFILVLSVSATISDARDQCIDLPDMTRCAVDEDCVVLDQVGCCGCTGGGYEGTVNHLMVDQLQSCIYERCELIRCTANYNCGFLAGAVCAAGRCESTVLPAISKRHSS